MTDQAEQRTVTRNDAEGQYEIRVGDALAGYSAFEIREPGRIVFTHTVIDRAFRGQGLGDVLAAEALADSARRGDVIVPECAFIVKYLGRNDVAGAIIDWPETEDAQDAATPGETPA